jgi:hypothetical protein
MDDLGHYFLAQARKDAAYQQYSYAGVRLTNAQIMERLAEIKSQHEPLASLLGRPLSERDRLYAAAFYVAIGRMPDNATPSIKQKGA